jgi:translation initiation factor 2D
LSSTPATQENGTNSTTSISEKTVVVIERFWKASASSVKLFQEMGASTSDPLPLPVIRGYLHDYITSHALIDSKNQAQIRLEDPILVHAMYPKAKLAEIPASLTRQELVDRLANTSCAEYHRTSRLLSERATQVHLANTKGKAGQVGVNGELEPQSEAEYVGVISPGAAKPVNIEIKSRQGRKAVSLVTGLETYGIDPQALANDLMKRGASASGECTDH